MKQNEILKIAKFNELDTDIQKRIQHFMTSCKDDGIFCNFSTDQTKILFYKDPEHKTQFQVISIALFYNLLNANR